MAEKKPTKTELAEAMGPVADGYFVITFPYTGLVVPHAAGMKLMEAFRQAEVMENHNYGNPTIYPISHDNNTNIKPMSRKAYEDIKMAQLLGIALKDLLGKKDIPF